MTYLYLIWLFAAYGGSSLFNPNFSDVKNSIQNLFFYHYFSLPKFLGTKILFDKINWCPKILFGQKCFGPKIWSDKNLLDPKFFGPKLCWTFIFRAHFFGGQMIFHIKILSKNQNALKNEVFLWCWPNLRIVLRSQWGFNKKGL